MFSFPIFSDNLLASNQLVMNFNSLFNESDVEFWSRFQYNVVSSAYISISNLLLTEGRSLIYIRNSNGPNNIYLQPIDFPSTHRKLVGLLLG